MKKLLQTLFILLIASIYSCQQQTPRPPYQIEKSAVVDKAAVVSAHPLASSIGLDIIKQGGNAVDAAIAVQYALAVVYPVAGNIGGGGFMIYRGADGTKDALDFREMAPSRANRDMYLDSTGNVIKGLSFDGHLAAGVPGTVDGMDQAFKRYSQLKDWAKLLDPAIALAENGFVITAQQAKNLNGKQASFKKCNTTMPVFVKEQAWQEGDILVQKDLAATLRRIRDKGRAGFYEGKTAELIVKEMQAGGGIMQLEDLKNYTAKWRQPVTTQYRDYQLVSMPPPSSGGIALAQLLEIVEAYPLDSYAFQSAEAVHLMAEAERRVYADRAQFLGDSDFYPVPLNDLLDANYLKQRMESFDANHSSNSDSITAGVIEIPIESEETTHFSIVDAAGNAVSLTTTINSGYGSKTVVTGAGFLLNNEMDDFSSKPGVPNFYGLIGAEANAIEPGKRMLSSMTPTIVEKEDKLFMVVGTPGGSTIITSVFQTFLNVVAFEKSMSEALSAPRFHHQWKPDQISVEPDALSTEVRAALEKMGHTVKERGSIGRVDAILVRPDGKLEAAADPRGDDHVAGM